MVRGTKLVKPNMLFLYSNTSKIIFHIFVEVEKYFRLLKNVTTYFYALFPKNFHKRSSFGFHWFFQQLFVYFFCNTRFRAHARA